MAVTDYQLIYAATREYLAEKVMSSLIAGWQPFDAPVVLEGYRNNQIAQAMIKGTIDGGGGGGPAYTLPAATSGELGGVKLGSDTVQSIAAAGVTTTANRTYAVQVNGDGQAVVNVPWADTNTTYAAATTSAAGLMSAADKTKVDELSNYTLPAASSTVLGGAKLFSDTVQAQAAVAVSATASRTYGIQVNAAGQAVVNVPWADTNTVYTLPNAAAAVRGGVLQGTAVADATDETDVVDQFNALLAVLRASGALAT